MTSRLPNRALIHMLHVAFCILHTREIPCIRLTLMHGLLTFMFRRARRGSVNGFERSTAKTLEACIHHPGAPNLSRDAFGILDRVRVVPVEELAPMVLQASLNLHVAQALHVNLRTVRLRRRMREMGGREMM
jgi:hypothetical protein